MIITAPKPVHPCKKPDMNDPIDMIKYFTYFPFTDSMG